MRDRARCLLAVLGTGLAFLTVAAGRPTLPREPAPAGLTGTVARVQAGTTPWGWEPAGASRFSSGAVTVARGSASGPAAALPRLRRLLQADLLVVAPSTLPGSVAAAVRRLAGVVAVQRVDAARIEVDGKFVAMLGVNPLAFRAFAPKPTARASQLWRNVANGGVAISYTMGKLDKLQLGRPLLVAGRHTERLGVAGFGTVGIAGVDAVVADSVARSLGIPADNAIVVSAPRAALATLMTQIKDALPRGAAIAALVAQAPASGVPVSSGAAGGAGVTASDGPGLSRAELAAFLKAAMSRLGMPYVWGAAGPTAFDCSGLVQWSLAQAGIVMPRVAVDQARAGPQLAASQLQPGDLLFYHTDPTAPSYISHVAIYLGNGLMIQAPEPGMSVEVVPAVFGSGFAGAVRVYPRVAAAVAADPAG